MKTTKQNWLVAIVVASMCCSSLTLRAENKSGAKDKAEHASSDSKFIEEAAKGGKAEVKIGELAQSKGQSDSVKQFGQRLVKDHTAANQQLEKICDRKGVSKSTDLGKHQKQIDHLTSLSGEEFDKAFIEHAVSDHKEDVEKFEKQANEGEDPVIRSFARETLPTLREHLRIAQTLQSNPSASIPELIEPAGAEVKPDSQSDSPEQKAHEQKDQQSDSPQNP